MSEKTDTTEIFTLDHDITVTGISLQKSGLPISFDSLGKLWVMYGEKYRTSPVTEYSVSLNTVPDYIAGCAEEFKGELPEEFVVQTIPKGKYIKDTFSADSFEELTGSALMKRNVAGWAKKNGVKINRLFSSEVYPWAEFAKGNFEMYALTPIKE